MKSTDYRNANWREIRKRVSRLQERALQAVRAHGPGTTKDIAWRMKIKDGCAAMDLLTLRPRVTELVKLGMIECLDLPGREGVYRALSEEEAEQAFELRKAEALRDAEPEPWFV